MYKVNEGNFKTMEFMTGLSEFSVFNPLMSIAPTLKELLGNFMTLKWSLAPCVEAGIVSIPYCTTNELNVISHILKLLITEQQVLRDCLVKSTVKTYA